MERTGVLGGERLRGRVKNTVGQGVRIGGSFGRRS